MRLPHIFQGLMACLLLMVSLLTLKTEDNNQRHCGKNSNLFVMGNVMTPSVGWRPSMTAETPPPAPCPPPGPQLPTSGRD
jgi:hypothetical protein